MDDISGGYFTGYHMAADGVPEHEIACACCMEIFRVDRMPRVPTEWLCDQCAEDNRDDNDLREDR